MALVVWLVVDAAGGLISRIPRRPAKHPILWSGDWLPTHNNIRQAELLRRFSLVKAVYRSVPPQRASLESLRGRLAYFWRMHLRLPFLFKIWSRRYRIHLCSSKTIWQAALFAGPVIVDEDDPVFSSERLTLLNRPNVICVVTSTEMLKQQFTKHGVDKPCFVIPSGFDSSGFSPQRATDIRSKLAAQNHIVVGYSIPEIFTDADLDAATHINPAWLIRSVSMLLDAMRLVWAQEAAAELWLIGHPSESVRAFADAEPRCRLPGYIPHDDLLNYIACFDIAVYPRTLDLFGRSSIKLIEFMAMGVPVVSTTVSEAAALRDAKAGLFADSTEEFANRILKLIHSPALRAELGNNGRQYAGELDWDYLAKRYESEVFARFL